MAAINFPSNPVADDLYSEQGKNWVFDGKRWISVPYDNDVDDVPVNGATTVPISSNWAYDHENDVTHPYTDIAKEWTSTQNFNSTTLTDGATISWDLSSNQDCSVTLAGNRTMAAPTNMKDGGSYRIKIIQDATGSRTLTWNAVFKFIDSNAPILTTTASGYDIITFRSNGTNLEEVGRSIGIG